MEPVGWVMDTVGSRHEHSATGNNGAKAKGGDTRHPFPESGLNIDSNNSSTTRTRTRSPPIEVRTASRSTTRAAADDEAYDGSSSLSQEPSHSSVDNLLRRIARDVNARQARANKRRSREAGNDDDNGKGSSMRDDSRYYDTTSRNKNTSGRRGADQPDTNTREGWQRRQISQGSARKSRWGTSTPSERHDRGREEHGASAQIGGGTRDDGGQREAPATAAVAAVSAAEANPFTESMWEDASCRQVLQAMFFSRGSAVPAGSTEEYKELEGKENRDAGHIHTHHGAHTRERLQQ